MSVPAAYMGIILIWSTTPLAIQWSSEEVGFLFGLTSRMTLGLALCVALLVILRVPFQWHREARETYLASGLGLYAAMLCVYWGAQFISSGLVSVVYGLLPIITFFIAAAVFGQSLWQPAKLLGALLGFVGLIVIFNPQDSVNLHTLFGVVAVCASATIHALSMIWVKKIGADIGALSVTSGGLSVAVPLYLFTWFLFDGQMPSAISDRTLSAIVYLGVMGSVVGFVAFYYALKRISTDVIALSTLITPVLALAIGHWLNQEPLQAEILAGAACILLGLAVHNWGEKIFVRV